MLCFIFDFSFYVSLSKYEQLHDEKKKKLYIIFYILKIFSILNFELIEVFSNNLSIIEGFCSKIVNRKITIDSYHLLGNSLVFLLFF